MRHLGGSVFYSENPSTLTYPASPLISIPPSTTTFPFPSLRITSRLPSFPLTLPPTSIRQYLPSLTTTSSPASLIISAREMVLTGSVSLPVFPSSPFPLSTTITRLSLWQGNRKRERRRNTKRTGRQKQREGKKKKGGGCLEQPDGVGGELEEYPQVNREEVQKERNLQWLPVQCKIGGGLTHTPGCLYHTPCVCVCVKVLYKLGTWVTLWSGWPGRGRLGE